MAIVPSIKLVARVANMMATIVMVSKSIKTIAARKTVATRGPERFDVKARMAKMSNRSMTRPVISVKHPKEMVRVQSAFPVKFRATGHPKLAASSQMPMMINIKAAMPKSVSRMVSMIPRVALVLLVVKKSDLLRELWLRSWRCL
jgi:hypothetical protein